MQTLLFITARIVSVYNLETELLMYINKQFYRLYTAHFSLGNYLEVNSISKQFPRLGKQEVSNLVHFLYTCHIQCTNHLQTCEIITRKTFVGFTKKISFISKHKKPINQSYSYSCSVSSFLLVCLGSLYHLQKIQSKCGSKHTYAGFFLALIVVVTLSHKKAEQS